jgi:hypothetical protein
MFDSTRAAVVRTMNRLDTVTIIKSWQLTTRLTHASVDLSKIAGDLAFDV